MPATASSATATSIRGSSDPGRMVRGWSPSAPRRRVRPVQHAASHRGGCGGSGLCRGPRQPADPGVRLAGQFAAADHHRRAVRSGGHAGDCNNPDLTGVPGGLHHARTAAVVICLGRLSRLCVQTVTGRQGVGLARGWVPKKGRSNSAGSTRSPARPKTRCMSPNCRTGGCRS